MYPAIYWVEFWDEFDKEMKQVSGCTFATSFADAAEKIEAYYGKDLSTVTIELLEESSVIEFHNYEEAHHIAECP